MSEILLNKAGKKIIILGNEAVIRGSLESGVKFVSNYPGTPASEIGNVFFRIAKRAGVQFEFSTNEKVAMEAAIGAAFSGLKALVAMKNFGLNVAIESLVPAMYTGVKKALVVVVADDVSCWSSAQSEQNSRAYSYLAHIPTLEPSDPQECKDFTKLAFKISEKFELPILIRLTTRVSHQRQIIILDKIQQSSSKGKFVKEPKRFVTMPPRVLEMKKKLLEKIEKIKDLSEKSEINKIILNSKFQIPASEGKVASKFGIITSGVSYLYVIEALKELGLNLPVLKLGFFYPLPEKKIKNFIRNLKKVLIVEELEPYLEKEVKILAKEVNPNLQFFGKNLFSEVGELRPENVIWAISKLSGKKYPITPIKSHIPVPKRKPQLCPGCPYWLVFSAIKKAVDPKKVIFGGDIGCYMLAGLPPHFLQDYLSCMGSSIGLAHGIKKVTDQKLITFIGDSTFFHAGIPALINTVFNKSNPLIIVMKNQTTAMTGLQPHPGAPAEDNGIQIEDIVRALGIKNLEIIDPINQKEMVRTIKDFLAKKEVSVIIAKRPCVFVIKKQHEKKNKTI